MVCKILCFINADDTILLSSIIDYTSARLRQSERTQELAHWLEVNMEAMKGIPRYLIPAYFDVIVTGTYELLTSQVLKLMPR